MNYGYGQTLRIVISDLQLVDVSLSGFLGEQEKRNPDRTYISGYFGQLSYRETLMSARRLSQHLALSNRIASSRSVGICTESPEYIVPAVWAAIFVDIDLVFLPYCRDPDVMFSTMKETSVAVLLTDMPSLLEKSWCLDVADMIQCDLSKDSQQQMPAMTFTTVPRQNDSGFVFQTSGTSGEPKWVKCGYRQYATVISCMLQNGTLEHARGQSVFLTPPLYHSYGLSAFLEYTAVGGMIIFPQGTSPLGPVGDIRDPWLRENVTAIEGVPYFYSQLSKLGGRFNMPALNHLGLGGGQLDRIAFGKLKEIYPAIAVSVRYGLTETPSVVSHRIIRSFSGEGWKSSGSVLPVYNVEIVDDNGQTLGTNQEGEIIVTGGCVGIYLGQAGARLSTGDTGYFTDNNELVISGRKSLYINNRGFRVSPERVESVFASFDGVQDCRVQMSGVKLVAEVVYHEGVSQSDLLAFVSVRLPSYAVPDELVRVESIPRTHSGKIKRYY
jgi:acyl-coenzyme A synthetase/AMP-(fatty) acid ligase